MEKNPVKLRKKKISGGVESLYLDIYDRGKRKYEFLGLYLHPGDRKYAVTDRNTMKAVEAIIARRTLEVINKKAGIQTESMMTVLDFMTALASKKNWLSWKRKKRRCSWKNWALKIPASTASSSALTRCWVLFPS